MLLKKSKRSLITMTDEVKSQNEQTGDSGEQTAQTNEQTVQSNSNDTNWKSLHENEVDYNKKLRGKNQELQTKLEQFEKNEAAARQKKMEEAGEFKTIIAEKDSEIESLKKHKQEFDDYKKYFCMHTYDYTILGACVRMIEFACFLGVSHLDFTGLDGVEAILEGKHAFQPGKTELPGVLKARAAYSSPSSLKNDSVYVFIKFCISFCNCLAISGLPP